MKITSSSTYTPAIDPSAEIHAVAGWLGRNELLGGTFGTPRISPNAGDPSLLLGYRKRFLQ